MAKHTNVKGKHLVQIGNHHGKIEDISITELGNISVKLKQPKGTFINLTVAKLDEIKNVVVLKNQ